MLKNDSHKFKLFQFINSSLKTIAFNTQSFIEIIKVVCVFIFSFDYFDSHRFVLYFYE